MHLNDEAKRTIQANVLNYLSGINPTDDIQLEFSLNEDDKESVLNLQVTKRSTNPSMTKSITFKDNSLEVNANLNNS